MPSPAPRIYLTGTPDTKSIEIPVKVIKIKLFVSGCFNKTTAITASIIPKGSIPNLKSCTLFFAQDNHAAK